MGDYERGVSPIDVSYNLALSMMNADKSYGEYVYRVGNGFMVLNIDQANQKEIDDAYDHMKKIQKGFVGSERHVFDVKTPLSFEPREFNFYFYRGLARVLEMPVSMFIGQNTGDVDIRDDRGEYYSAIKSTQETLLNPFVKSVISELLGIKKEIANYRIIWNDIYVDVRTQGEAMRFMASSIRMLSMALIEQKEEELDFITIEEARNILGLPPRIPDTDYPQEPPEDDPEEEKKEHTTGFLKKRDKQGMEQMKKFAKKEREIGEKIIREQNNDNI
jgi:hydrogenase maturation factor